MIVQCLVFLKRNMCITAFVDLKILYQPQIIDDICPVLLIRYLNWIGLVYLFNDISTHDGLPKAGI